jgi:RNA polymerase sigma-70 factor (ECF subfamily)
VEKPAVSDPHATEWEGLRARQAEVCERFVDAHYRGVYRFFLWLTHNADTASDLTQETFAAFWQSADGLGPEQAPDLKAWLYGIARNRWRKARRDGKNGGGPVSELQNGAGDPSEGAPDMPDERPGPERVTIGALEAERVIRAVAELPPDYREALVLRVFQELAYGQIAAALGIGEGLARWRVHHARLRLRAALERGAAEETQGKEGTGASRSGR